MMTDLTFPKRNQLAGGAGTAQLTALSLFQAESSWFDGEFLSWKSHPARYGRAVRIRRFQSAAIAGGMFSPAMPL
jgi:hypothetical protein